MEAKNDKNEKANDHQPANGGNLKCETCGKACHCPIMVYRGDRPKVFLAMLKELGVDPDISESGEISFERNDLPWELLAEIDGGQS
jgi:hypothetical protein